MRKALTKAEEQVMQALWEVSRGGLRDIVDAMPNPKLLSSLYPLRYREFTHAFFKSPIKQRLIMLSKPPQRLRLLRQCMIVPLVAVKEGAQEKKPFVTVKPVEGQTEPYSIDVTVQETEKQGVVTVRFGDVQLTAETVEVNTLDGTTYYVTSAAPQEKVRYVAADSTSAKQHFYIELKKK